MVGLSIESQEIVEDIVDLERDIKNRMDLLHLQKSLQVWRKETAFLRVMDEDIRRKNLLVFKLTERTHLVHHSVNIGLILNREGLADPMLDLCYEEDSQAEVDMNVVRTGSGRCVEVQATAESRPFAADELDHLLDLAAVGIRNLTEQQRSLVPPKFSARAR